MVFVHLRQEDGWVDVDIFARQPAFFEDFFEFSNFVVRNVGPLFLNLGDEFFGTVFEKVRLERAAKRRLQQRHHGLAQDQPDEETNGNPQ